MVKVALMNYGIGNFGSLLAGFRRLDCQPEVWTGGPDAHREAKALADHAVDLVVLPGVGSLSHARESLETRGLWDLVWESHRRHYPLVGICLGLQLFFGVGAEGGSGLGLIPGTVPRLDHPRLPHIGWNRVTAPSRRTLPPILGGAEGPQWFYFVHSYHVAPENPDVILGVSAYGSEQRPTFPAVVLQDELLGMQFHPELSGEAGHRLLSGIIEEVHRHGSLAGLGSV